VGDLQGESINAQYVHEVCYCLLSVSHRNSLGLQEGCPVRNYILHRRDANAQGEFGNWQLLDLFYDTLAILTDQPRTIELEYRVKAMNPAGESLSSNTATVVL